MKVPLSSFTSLPDRSIHLFVRLLSFMVRSKTPTCLERANPFVTCAITQSRHPGQFSLSVDCRFASLCPTIILKPPFPKQTSVIAFPGRKGATTGPTTSLLIFRVSKVPNVFPRILVARAAIPHSRERNIDRAYSFELHLLSSTNG